MSNELESKIEVKSRKLANIIADVGSGKYRIPQFQREYVWAKSKVRALFDSIYQEFPIGSFFLWDSERDHNKLFRHLVGLEIPPVGDHDHVSFILDGQQRITSLYVTLTGMMVNGVDYRSIVFDLKEQNFKDRAADNKRFIAVCDIWGSNSLQLSRQLDEAYLPAFDRCWGTLRNYPVPVIEVRDKDLPAVCKIFQRINQGGQRLSRFDLISAMTYTLDFDLRDRFKKDVISRLNEKAFGEIEPVVMTQLLALYKHGLCTERYEYSLTADDIKSMWDVAVDAILLAADTLRKNMGVISKTYLPYGAFVTLLGYYYMKSGNRSMPQAHLEWAKRWFWRASFAQHYGSSGPTRVGQDKLLFDELIEGKEPVFDVPVRITLADLVKTKMTLSGSAIRNAFLCLLANLNPVHLVNNSPLDLVRGGISDFTSNEKHHIFPRAYLDDHRVEGAESHALPNFCFLTAELNKRILKSEPAVYFAELKKENPEFERAARASLLPTDEDSGIWEKDYLKFIRARGEAIIQEIGRLCGEITTPRQEERQAALERLEQRLRNCIHNNLTQQVGEKYWKSNIPQEVRENAEQRIQAELKKNPALRPNDFAMPRAKLDYVNVMDYRTIIESGANWSYFAPLFRRKEDLQTYLGSFSEFRNAVMHSRPMSELVRMKGETALLWFNGILPDEEPLKETNEDEEGEE